MKYKPNRLHQTLLLSIFPFSFIALRYLTTNIHHICFPTPASTAKMKVKSMLGGGGADAKKPSKSGGIGGLFPSAGDTGNGNKEKKGGLFGGLLSTPQDEMKPGGAAGGGAGGGAGGESTLS